MENIGKKIKNDFVAINYARYIRALVFVANIFLVTDITFFFNFQYDRICIQRSKSEWRALDVSTASIIQAWLLPYHGRSLVTAATLRIFQYLYTEYSTFFGMLLENLNNQYLFCCWVTFNIFAFNKRKHASTQAGRFSFNDALFYELATWHTLSYVVIWQTVNLPLMLCTQ